MATEDEDYTAVDETLSPLHAEIYRALRQAWLLYGVGPSQTELAVAVGRCSLQSIRNATRELKKRGYVTGQKFGVRALKPTDMNRIVYCRKPDPWVLDLAPLEEFWLA